MPASLVSASIRGIRSYSPFEHKTQTIEFYPLTLIVGPNGSGKTTVIETLKFMIAGEEPPLSDSRRNFLHSSKNPIQSFDKGIPYASIDLEFYNTRSELCHARRQIHKLDGTKSTTPVSSAFKIENGAWKNVHRLDDWNKTIPHLFNLPNQALLSHVILCHQEDNQWCMGDSNSVKQIFDKIFGCEQYKKEIKYIDVELKGSRGDLALSEKDASYLKEKVECKKRVIATIENLESEIKAIADKEELLSEDIENAVRKKKQIDHELSSYEQSLRTIDNLRGRETELKIASKRILGELNENLIDPQTVSDEEFDSIMSKHKSLLEKSRSRQLEITKRENMLTQDSRKQELEKNSIQEIINKMTVMELKSTETHSSLLEKLENLKFDQNLDHMNCDNIQDSIEILKEVEKDLAQNKSNKTEMEDKLSSKQQKLSKSIVNLEGLYQGILHKIKSKENFLKKLNDQLARADPMAKDLHLVVENLKQVSGITQELPSSNLMDLLNRLVDESTSVLTRVLRKLENDNINQLNDEIKKETNEIELSKEKMSKMEKEKAELSLEHKNIEAEQMKVRIASKDAHNKAIAFASAKADVISTFEKYCREKKTLDANVMAKHREGLARAMEKIESNHREFCELGSEKSTLQREIDAALGKNDEYRLNSNYRQILKQLEEAREKIKSSISDKPLDEKKVVDMRNELSQLEKKLCSSRDARSSLLGSKSQLENSLVKTRSELKNYSDCNQKYAQNLAKVVCNKMVISDLIKLKECLQHSVTTFHVQMISKINEVLRSRWRQIYKGTDIDHIELVDEEVIKGKDKKTYNYYIAMRKNGLRMKMREKSSTGQRALASIILRMALAELFVRDFTFIALDEPTANLDYANIQSLSKAIGTFVKRRADRGANLQWIIITHDEQFLNALDQNISPYFYRIQLDHEGCSKIMKSPFQNLSTDDKQDI